MLLAHMIGAELYARYADSTTLPAPSEGNPCRVLLSKEDKRCLCTFPEQAGICLIAAISFHIGSPARQHNSQQEFCWCCAAIVHYRLVFFARCQPDSVKQGLSGAKSRRALSIQEAKQVQEKATR